MKDLKEEEIKKRRLAEELALLQQSQQDVVSQAAGPSETSEVNYELQVKHDVPEDAVNWVIFDAATGKEIDFDNLPEGFPSMDQVIENVKQNFALAKNELQNRHPNIDYQLNEKNGRVTVLKDGKELTGEARDVAMLEYEKVVNKFLVENPIATSSDRVFTIQFKHDFQPSPKNVDASEKSQSQKQDWRKQGEQQAASLKQADMEEEDPEKADNESLSP